MKLRWPTRYERTRLFLLVAATLQSYAALTSDGEKAAHLSIGGAVYFCAYLIAGLLKPLHDGTGEDA